MCRSARQKGYTLIELLLYVSIVGSLLTAVSLYFASSTESRVKNQTIAEVNQQGALAMERITQAIRNANSITSPSAGVSASSLTLSVPTGALSPTVFSLATSGGTTMGYDQQGSDMGFGYGNTMTALKVVAPVSGTVSTLYAYVGTAAPAGSNKSQMAIYSGEFNPATRLANSTTVLISNNTWIAFPISPVSVTAGSTYWIAYNTVDAGSFYNGVYSRTGTSGQSQTQAQAYGSWPASWLGTSGSIEHSLYAQIDTGGGGGSDGLQVTEGSSAAVLLTNDKVQISGLTFTNLTRTGTPGVVQVSFTVSRVNPNNRNEYDYQKTFTSTAAVRP